ncbi:glycosyltransferase family 2 protein [Nitrincola alkalilacustris]|uniref:glycosyltransferase family 2 protein n=1 Tax=Nitrincola alkalilacustris TaxID=1571224 RepID=UPI00124C0574|nr:glycosyltransferase family 2 protein [Nitrincola alkalilacustris]
MPVKEGASLVRVSVCLASFNGEAYIESQVSSILEQLDDTDELIISDNGSTDSTLDIVYGFQDSRIKIFSCSLPGPVANFNHALKQARGEYIFLADQDDIWYDTRLVQCLEQLIEYDLVVTDCKVVNEQLTPMYPSFFQLRDSGPGFYKNLLRNSYQGCCMAFNRHILEASLPIPTDVPMHDWWIGLVAERVGRVCFLPVPLLFYRRHQDSASHTAGKTTAGWLTQLRWRWILLRRLSGVHG